MLKHSCLFPLNKRIKACNVNTPSPATCSTIREGGINASSLVDKLHDKKAWAVTEEFAR